MRGNGGKYTIIHRCIDRFYYISEKALRWSQTAFFLLFQARAVAEST